MSTPLFEIIMRKLDKIEKGMEADKARISLLERALEAAARTSFLSSEQWLETVTNQQQP